MNVTYVVENLLLATREYRNWPEAVRAIVSRRDLSTITLRNGLRIKGAGELKWLMNQIFYRKVYTPIPQMAIGPHDVVMDVGANCGVFTLYAASLTSGSIYSLEPSPDNFHLLQDNVTANGLDNVVLLPVALDSQAGEAKFLLNRRTHQENVLHYDHLDFEQLIPRQIEEYEEITVPTTTLEQVMEQHRIRSIDFLKIDCQGAEGAILSSTPQECLRKINKIAMEYHDHISLLKHEELRQILTGAGFVTSLVKVDPASPLGFLYGWRERLN